MAKKQINWAMWSVIGTAGWFMYEYMKKKEADATAAQQSTISINTPSLNSTTTLPTNAYQTPGIAQNTSATNTASAVALPNIQGMTADAISNLATQMDSLGMTSQAMQLRAYVADMKSRGVTVAPTQSI
jgi:hypothetical protein